MINLSRVLIRPIITEKTSNANAMNMYTFVVDKSANKMSIKQAVKHYFNVDVISINTTIAKGKVKRFGKSIGKRSDYKKAIIKIPEGQTLPIWGTEE